MHKKSNIAIIGMAGVGKSYISKRLAKSAQMSLVEVDSLIKEKVSELGYEYNNMPDDVFIDTEKQAINSLKNVSNTVIDTGASVIYSSSAMATLGSCAHIIYITEDVAEMKKRHERRPYIQLRGMEGKTFEQLFDERKPLYEKYADTTISRDISRDNDIELVITEIIDTQL
jgi:shikimate kinase